MVSSDTPVLSAREGLGEKGHPVDHGPSDYHPTAQSHPEFSRSLSMPAGTVTPGAPYL